MCKTQTVCVFCRTVSVSHSKKSDALLKKSKNENKLLHVLYLSCLAFRA